MLLAHLLVGQGDGILITDPAYPCVRNFIKLRDAEPQLVPVVRAQAYQPSVDDLIARRTDITRGVWLASPNNPTGTILDRAQLEALSTWTRCEGLHLLVDEIYHGLHFVDDLPSVLEVDDSAFVVNSFSKYFGMTGWRLGWMVVPESAISGVEKLAQNLFICPSSIAQYAALAAFSEEARSEMDRNRSAFKQRRDYLLRELKALGFGIPVEPSGAFYIYAQLPEGCGNSEAFCHDLLERHSVAVTPGTDFGYFDADRYVRFSYAQDIDLLRQGIKQLKQALTT